MAERSLEHAREAGSPQLEASSHTVLGRVHAERGDLEAAKLELESSSRLLRGIRHPYERAVLLAEQGRLLGRVGADEAGAERLRRAQQQAAVGAALDGDVLRSEFDVPGASIGS